MKNDGLVYVSPFFCVRPFCSAPFRPLSVYKTLFALSSDIQRCSSSTKVRPVRGLTSHHTVPDVLFAKNNILMLHFRTSRPVLCYSHRFSSHRSSLTWEAEQQKTVRIEKCKVIIDLYGLIRVFRASFKHRLTLMTLSLYPIYIPNNKILFPLFLSI